MFVRQKNQEDVFVPATESSLRRFPDGLSEALRDMEAGEPGSLERLVGFVTMRAEMMRRIREGTDKSRELRQAFD